MSVTSAVRLRTGSPPGRSARETTGSRRRPSTKRNTARPTTARATVAPWSLGVDGWLLGAVALLFGLGLVLVYSSSAAHAAKTYGDAEHFLWLHFVRAVLGVGLAMLMMMVPGAALERRAGWVLVAAVVLLVAVLIPGLGVVRGGARRWLELGPLAFQPSEVAKLAVVIGLATIFARREQRPLQARPSLLIPVMVAQVPVVLILAEPDLGTALVIELIVATLVFVAGVRLRTLIALGLLALPVFYHLVVSADWRLRRILAFIDPWAYRQTIGYQLSEALISIGSGGVFGLGLGEGKHGLFFLPEAHTDFIFAILAQELGLVGVLLLLTAFGVVIWRGVSIAAAATHSFDRYLAMGLTALIGIPAVFNTAVVTGLLPTKGLPLPLVSYGGSNLMITLAAVGLLLRIERDGRAAGGDK